MSDVADQSIDQFFAAIKEQTRVAMAPAVDVAGDLLLAEMKRLTSLIDHDLMDLKQMGHPYRQGAPQGEPHSDWLVHIQNGDLEEGLSRSDLFQSPVVISVDLNSDAKHTWFLLLGTRFMRPRDYVSAAILNQRHTIEALWADAFGGAAEGSEFKIRTELIPHETYPAQLPSGEG